VCVCVCDYEFYLQIMSTDDLLPIKKRKYLLFERPLGFHLCNKFNCIRGLTSARCDPELSCGFVIVDPPKRV
jgi:hypothetical protein